MNAYCLLACDSYAAAGLTVLFALAPSGVLCKH